MKLILTARPKATGYQFTEASHGGTTITAEIAGRSEGPPHCYTVDGKTYAVEPFMSVIVEAKPAGGAMFQWNKRYRVTIEELSDEQ